MASPPHRSCRFQSPFQQRKQNETIQRDCELRPVCWALPISDTGSRPARNMFRIPPGVCPSSRFRRPVVQRPMQALRVSPRDPPKRRHTQSKWTVRWGAIPAYNRNRTPPHLPSKSVSLLCQGTDNRTFLHNGSTSTNLGSEAEALPLGGLIPPSGSDLKELIDVSFFLITCLLYTSDAADE